jgi:hypothetical protein
MADRIIPLLVLLSGIALFGAGEVSRVAAASDEDCRKFHRECSEAKAQGYGDVGICNVERLECPPRDDAESGVGQMPRGVEPRPDDQHDRERGVGP